MSVHEEWGIPICEKCQLPVPICLCETRKNECASSPLESVVQPQQDSGVPLNPDRSAGSKLRLASRTRIADLEYELTEAINRVMTKHGESISYAELTVALSTKMRAWAGYWLKDELEDTD